MTRARRLATIAHRYVGLGLAGFLTIVGLTGAAIAWNNELERVFAPALFVLPADAARRPALDPLTLREAAERAAPGFAIDGVDLAPAPDQPILFSVQARPGGPAPRDDEIALDPATGRLIGQRRYGDLAQGSVNLMPFLYQLHESLALGGPGALILGIVALFWTIDCFVGAWLTFPVRARPARVAREWAGRWWQSWRVRRAAPRFKLTFDLHRAGGLWLWGMLFVVAWSSVGFNLSQVYDPVMTALFGASPAAVVAPAVKAPGPPRLSWRAAHRVGQALMAREAARRGFVVRAERLMFYDPATHVFFYRVRSNRDPGALGNTQIRFDGDTGRMLAIDVPTGDNARDTVTTWLGDLHTANVFGRTMQVVMTIVGLGTAMLSITGVLLWWRKLSVRRSVARKKAGRAGSPPDVPRAALGAWRAL